MGKLLRVICCVAFVGLLGSNLSADTIVFSDDFESGALGAWTQAASPLTISTAQNIVPASGQYSAQINTSADRMYANIGSEVSGHIMFTSWIYETSAATRAFTEIRAYSGAGYADGALQQVLAIGKYSSTTNETYDGTKYQGRVAFGSINWFNLNAPGAPSRSSDTWHRFDIEIMPSGSDINFYVDGILSRSITGAPVIASYDSLAVGLGAGSTLGDSWVDGFSVSIVPEPGSVALLISGLAALVGLALVRVRRRSG